MTKCSDCKKEPKRGSITGKDEETRKTKTLCWACFGKYELVPNRKTNVFRKKGAKK